MGVSKNGSFTIEHPIKMDDLGGTPVSGNYHIPLMFMHVVYMWLFSKRKRQCSSWMIPNDRFLSSQCMGWLSINDMTKEVAYPAYPYSIFDCLGMSHSYPYHVQSHPMIRFERGESGP